VTHPMLALMAPTDGPNAGLTMLVLQIGAIAAVFYFFILRPQQQARKKHEALLKNLKKGDEVTTVGGLIGKVKDIKDERVTVESGTASVVVERARIARIGDQAAPGGIVG
jgi:preprotein translocase subunit YajC